MITIRGIGYVAKLPYQPNFQVVSSPSIAKLTAIDGSVIRQVSEPQISQCETSYSGAARERDAVAILRMSCVSPVVMISTGFGLFSAIISNIVTPAWKESGMRMVVISFDAAITERIA